MTDINHSTASALKPEAPYVRRRSSVARVGQTAIGGDNPIRVQSMTPPTPTTQRLAWRRPSVSSLPGASL